MSPKACFHVLKLFKCNQLYEFGNYWIPTLLSRRRGNRLTCRYKIEIRGGIISFLYKGKDLLYRPGQTLRVPEGRGSRISRQWAQEIGKVVSPAHRSPLFLVFIYIRSWVDPTAIARPEVSSRRKFSKTPSGIESATFRPQPTAPPRTPEFIV